MKKTKKRVVQSAVLLITLISKESFSSGLCMPWKCIEQGAFANVGTLSNPGPHTVCVGDSPPAPQITGTSVTLGTIARTCTEEIPGHSISPSSPEIMTRSYINNRESRKEQPVSTDYIIEPPLPEIYQDKDIGSHTYKIKVKSSFEVCGKLGTNEIGQIKINVQETCGCVPDYCMEMRAHFVKEWKFEIISIDKNKEWIETDKSGRKVIDPKEFIRKRSEEKIRSLRRGRLAKMCKGYNNRGKKCECVNKRYFTSRDEEEVDFFEKKPFNASSGSLKGTVTYQLTITGKFSGWHGLCK